MVGFINTKYSEKPQNDIKLTILSYPLYTFVYFFLSFSSCNTSQCVTKPANKIKKVNCVNETVKFNLKLNYGFSFYMLSTNWTRVWWGISPLASCTNVKSYWSAKQSCASNIRNHTSYANYAATNQIHVFLVYSYM